ncbi:ChaN family lipoprotein [Shumkonia mesophila]|uniref:ChaN family lipoprotein n=1 Tax=Shumkonia mesophila TaxID=2838854 RepID=UPI002934447A|nr:ChaN family lipoprotein [Shumkonia mesophila]
MRTHLLPFVSLLCACAAGSGSGGDPAPNAACPPAPGGWLAPATGRPVALPALLDTLAGRPAVVLGETHASAEDHRWQLHTLAALHGRSPDMVLGFEAFPRGLQSVLDRWVAGEIDERTFLEQSEWDEVWGFPSSLYLPLFDFARMHRIPMVALNVERALVARVGKDGWDAVPADAREGVGTPAPASPPYVAALARVFGEHRPSATAEATSADDPAFRRFVEAQITWDRAMAEAIAAGHARPGGPLVVAVVGRGHAEYGFGIPHQLADLGLHGTAVLVTWPAGRDCAELLLDGKTAVADAVFGVATEAGEAAPQGPRLGVRLGQADGGVRIEDVAADSVAAAAGLKTGDLVREAAGRPVGRPGDLAATIRRQPYGTWLPLKVERDGALLDLIARFPASPHPPLAGPNPHRRPGAGTPP